MLFYHRDTWTQRFTETTLCALCTPCFKKTNNEKKFIAISNCCFLIY